jgi:flagellar motor protein MotB
MAVEAKHVWLAAAGVAIVAGVASFGVFRSVIGVKHDIAALNDKVDATSGALDGIKTLTKMLAKIEKASSLDSVKSDLDAVNAKIERANAALGDIQKNGSLSGLKTTLASLNAKVETLTDAMAEMQKTAAAVKPSADALTSLNAKIDQLSAALAQMREAAATIDESKHEAAHGGELTKIGDSIDALKTRVEADGAALGKIAATVAKLDAVSAPGPEQAKTKGGYLAVITVAMPEAAETTGSAGALAAGAPLTVRYERVGSLDDNGQAAAIAKKVQSIVKSHKDCAITVAGHADTLGDDSNNLELSRERASKVAANLKAALGNDVPIKIVAWGERNLKVWTPDETARTANRSVDINVSCKG